ncbi:MAG: hypothetical protein FWD68_21030 [Alphaproteobacteria bacterium]|nr:hypothetical protein [Alphaproteobacteria bacterium]
MAMNIPNTMMMKAKSRFVVKCCAAAPCIAAGEAGWLEDMDFECGSGMLEQKAYFGSADPAP